MSTISELKAKVERLKEREHELRDETTQNYKDIEEAEIALAEEQMKHIGPYIAKYEAKLERIRKYVEGFIKNKKGRDNIKYAFRKVEIYKDDFHDPMPDPLNWKIAEYDLLDMDQYVEIIFDYHSEAVKRFVSEWMKEHLHYACEDEESSFSYFKN